jgi:serine protease Do
VVNELYPGGPAERAGLAPGDVILTVGGQPVLDLKAMNFRLATMGVGATAGLGVLRRAEALDLELPLEPPPEEPASDPRLLDGHQPLAGATVVNLSPKLAEDLGIADLWRGVMVLKVARGSPARRLGFRPGDLIWGVNGEDIEDTAELEAVIDAATSDVWQLEVERDGHRTSFEVKG